MPRLKRTAPGVRLNLNLSAPTRATLEALRDRTEADSLSEVIRRALALYEFLLEERAAGRKLVIQGGGVEREVVLL